MSGGVEYGARRKGWAYPRRWGQPDVDISGMNDEQAEAAIARWAASHAAIEQRSRQVTREARSQPLRDIERRREVPADTLRRRQQSPQEKLEELRRRLVRTDLAILAVDRNRQQQDREV